MAKQEHLSLSQYLKDVHSTLRKTASILGAEKAWNEHCKNHSILVKYAENMEKLATHHWENNYASDTSEATSRIEWAVNYCINYFNNEEYAKYRQKEQDIASKIDLKIDCKEVYSKPLKLIDVGSCYNPFKVYEIFDVLAIDLCPANNTVLQCDFLYVPIGNETIIEDSKLVQLQVQTFDVVTFCFLLEYIPSSDLRILACEKAYAILKPGGLLIINTPDSKHVGANSNLMKCWRYTLAQLGFSRIKYEKFRHMHCMAFRKALDKSIASRWANLYKEPYMKYAIQIPQDFQNYDTEDKYPTYELPTNTDYFQEMPFHEDLS